MHIFLNIKFYYFHSNFLLLNVLISYIIFLFGDWGLGIGDWGLGPIPNPQSPIPNPQSPIMNIIIKINMKFIIQIKYNF